MKSTSILKNKTVIIGCGRLGASIAIYCSSKGKNVILLDNNEKSFDLIDNTNFSGITDTGDATSKEFLEKNHIKTAKELIVLTGDDNTNLYIAMMCKHYYGVPSIYVRFADPSLGDLLEKDGIKTIYPFELSFRKFLDLGKEKK